ncbi:MAG: PAS domain-containing protein [Acidobacteriaceae bacterium]|nr:PAS domain-containing protein [Acidobacteriaceae bacterium]
MSLQARLTLWSIVLMAVIVGIVSSIDLAQEVNRQLAAARDRADLIGQLVNAFVQHSAARDPANPRGAVAGDAEHLSTQLVSLMSGPLSEIAVCDNTGRVLADSLPRQIGKKCPDFPDWYKTLDRCNWWDKVRLLLRDTHNYSIADELSAGEGSPVIFVKLVVRPQFIRREMVPVLKRNVLVSLASIIGAMFAAFLFSSIAFRPLGKLTNMLDLIARGEYEIPVESAKETPEEFNVVASKVNLLGQKLRGAQTEFSDLKTNIERLLEELEDAVLIFGRDRRLIAAAGAVERFLGRPRNELLNQSILEIFPQGTPLALFLGQATQTGRVIRNRRVPLSGLHPHQNGLPFALLSVESFGSSAAGGILIRLRDPEATRQIGKELQIADRLSAINRLTAGVAHEVKNPLNAILMHVELARFKLSHGDYDIDQQMEIISNEILRLDRVVKTFLDFTRPVQLTLSDTKVSEFMDEIVGLARPQAEAAGIEIIEAIDAEDATITADVDLLKQAVLNIVVNAIEAMSSGGTLRVECSLKGDFAEIRIADTGPGIPPEVKNRIYDLYFTTKQHGSGIGLAMTYRIVQLHDGTIDFTSDPEHGTTFVLRLPVAVLVE